MTTRSPNILQVLTEDVLHRILLDIKSTTPNFSQLRLVSKALNDLVGPIAFRSTTITFSRDIEHYVRDQLSSMAFRAGNPNARWTKRLRIRGLVPVRSPFRQDDDDGRCFEGAEYDRMLVCQSSLLGPAVQALKRVESVELRVAEGEPYLEVLRALKTLPGLREISLSFCLPFTSAYESPGQVPPQYPPPFPLDLFSNLRKLEIIDLPPWFQTSLHDTFQRVLAQSPDIEELMLTLRGGTSQRIRRDGGSDNEGSLALPKSQDTSLSKTSGRLVIPATPTSAGNPSSSPSTQRTSPWTGTLPKLKKLTVSRDIDILSLFSSPSSSSSSPTSSSSVPFLRLSSLQDLEVTHASNHATADLASTPSSSFWTAMRDSNTHLRRLSICGSEWDAHVVGYLLSYEGCLSSLSITHSGDYAGVQSDGGGDGGVGTLKATRRSLWTKLTTKKESNMTKTKNSGTKKSRLTNPTKNKGDLLRTVLAHHTQTLRTIELVDTASQVWNLTEESLESLFVCRGLRSLHVVVSPQESGVVVRGREELKRGGTWSIGLATLFSRTSENLPNLQTLSLSQRPTLKSSAGGATISPVESDNLKRHRRFEDARFQRDILDAKPTFTSSSLTGGSGTGLARVGFVVRLVPQVGSESPVWFFFDEEVGSFRVLE